MKMTKTLNTIIVGDICTFFDVTLMYFVSDN